MHSSARPFQETTTSAAAATAAAGPKRSSSLPNVTTPLKNRRSSSLRSHPATSISKHYALNNQILLMFDSLHDNKKYEVAYAIGLQFVEMALLEIPQHGYFYSNRHDDERVQSSLDAVRVTQLLQQILDEEPKASRVEKTRIEKLSLLAHEQARQTTTLSLEQYEPDRASVAAELDLLKAEQAAHNENDPCGVAMFCGRILDWNEAVSAVLCPPHTTDNMTMLPPTTTSTASYTTTKQQQQQHGRILQSSPLEQSTPPLLVRTVSEMELERALFLSGMEVAPTIPEDEITTTTMTTTMTATHLRTSSHIDVSTLRACYHDDFDTLRDAGRVQISRVETYQGRLYGSINGCTLIAPLLCLYHFHNHGKHHNTPDSGLPDAVIVQVIDEVTPALLPDVRGDLGLTKDALIIPSDVNDFLMERGMFSQENFVTVCGGNILEEQHIQELVHGLRAPLFPKKKIAATIFFHEHVIAIHKLRRGGNKVWFDLIDSLPYQETMSRVGELDEQFHDESFDLQQSSSDWGDGYIPYAARIRCLDEEALTATLRWYGCSKFTKENRTYINMYKWDDRNSDFDPRVFQAFIWAEA